MEPPKKRRNYRCQRCFHHGATAALRGHICPYKENHRCSMCDLNSMRRLTTKFFRESDPAPFTALIRSTPPAWELRAAKTLLNRAKRRQNPSRSPKCKKCRMHGTITDLKGHARSCPYDGCVCIKCLQVDAWRTVMRSQIKLRRCLDDESKVTDDETEFKRPATPVNFDLGDIQRANLSRPTVIRTGPKLLHRLLYD